MADIETAQVTVAASTPEEAPGALALLYAHLPPEDAQAQIGQTLRDWRAGLIDLSELWCARRGRQLVGAALAVVQPGKTAMLWPPALVETAEAARVADALIEAATARLASRGVRIVQALVDPSDGPTADCLVRNGYAKLTGLVYLERDLGGRLPSGARRLRYVSLEGASRQEFEQVIEQTYEGSLDLPALNGARPIGEVVAGHQAVGRFDPARWLLAFADGRAVGCLLLAEHSELAVWEVVYVGVVPWARGRGFGRELTLEGLARAQRGGMSRLVLAVDRNNQPARKTYDSLGFRQWDERSVHVRVLAPLAGAEN